MRDGTVRAQLIALFTFTTVPSFIEDQSGVIQDSRDLLNDAIYSVFIEAAPHNTVNRQSARFAISPTGIVRNDTLFLPVSEEFCKLVVSES